MDVRLAKFEGSPNPVVINPDSVTGFGRYDVANVPDGDGEAEEAEDEGFVNGDEFVDGADLLDDEDGEEYYEEDLEEEL